MMTGSQIPPGAEAGVPPGDHTLEQIQVGRGVGPVPVDVHEVAGRVDRLVAERRLGRIRHASLEYDIGPHFRRPGIRLSASSAGTDPVRVSGATVPAGSGASKVTSTCTPPAIAVVTIVPVRPPANWKPVTSSEPASNSRSKLRLVTPPAAVSLSGRLTDCPGPRAKSPINSALAGRAPTVKPLV